MKKYIYILALLLLTGCTDDSSEAPDGYYFEEPEYVKDRLIVKMELFTDRDEFESVARDLMGPNIVIDQVQAFGTLNPEGNSCTIYTWDARVKYQPEYWGHELAHCVYGKWHEEQNRRRDNANRLDNL